MGISPVRSGRAVVQTEFFFPFDLSNLRVIDDDLDGSKPDVLDGVPKNFICILWGASVESHSAKSDVSLKYLNPIKIRL